MNLRKSTRQQLRSIRELRASIATSRDVLCHELAERPEAPPDAECAYRVLFDHLEAELRAAGRDVFAAENAYQDAKLRPGEIRLERNRAARDLSDLYEPLRQLRRALPLRAARVLHVKPTFFEALAYHMPGVIQLLREFEREPPQAVRGFCLDAGELADDMEAGLRRLKDSIEALIEVERGVTFLWGHAACTSEEAGRVVSWVMSTLKSIGVLVGEEDLVKQAR